MKASNMTDENKPLKIEFAPGCFDNFDGTQEELDALVKEIQSMFENKTREEIEAESIPLTDEEFDELPDDVKAQLIRSYNEEDDDEDDLPSEFRRNLQ
jgi:hypothetical protein